MLVAIKTIKRETIKGMNKNKNRKILLVIINIDKSVKNMWQPIHNETIRIKKDSEPLLFNIIVL